MKTEWDYTNLADAYLKRPDYSEVAIDAMLSIADLGRILKSVTSRWSSSSNYPSCIQRFSSRRCRAKRLYAKEWNQENCQPFKSHLA